MYYIQSRWKLEGRKLCYYGLRSGENMFRNSVPVSKRQAGILSALPTFENGCQMEIGSMQFPRAFR